MELENGSKPTEPCELDETQANCNPIELFRCWFDLAHSTNLYEPTAMTLATVSGDGKPSARVVLLKDFSDQGFVFYTNYSSRKGSELAGNPYAALVFYWDQLRLQVRIEGVVTKVSRDQSQRYFHSRPRGSQLGALASPQSHAIKNRQVLDQKMQLLAERYRDRTVPVPENWGGFLLAPVAMEFWQGRSDRLHDRLYYERQADDSWQITRLAP